MAYPFDDLDDEDLEELAEELGDVFDEVLGENDYEIDIHCGQSEEEAEFEISPLPTTSTWGW